MKTLCHLSFITACLLVSAAAGRADLIVNGGFETGDFTGWTVNANSYPMYIVTYPVHGGAYAAQIAGYSYFPDTLSQTVATTAGQSYTLDFWRFIGDGGPVTSLVVDWDGQVVYSESDGGINLNAGQYQEISANVAGTGSDTLEFICANDPSETYLDDVSLTPSVPDGGATIAMLGLGLAGLAGVRRKLGR